MDLARLGKTSEIIAAAGIAGLRCPWLPSEVPETDRELVYRMGDAMTVAMVADYAGCSTRNSRSFCKHIHRGAECSLSLWRSAFVFRMPTAASKRSRKWRTELALDHVPMLVQA